MSGSTKVLTTSFAVIAVKSFIDDIGNSANSNTSFYYLAISDVTPWANEAAPPNGCDNIYDANHFWRGMLGGTRINITNMSLAVPRINWSSNTAYAQYTNTSDIFGTPFYVLTDVQDNVYKCLGNNNGGISTFQPTTTDFLNPQTTEDGYVWKYMYTMTDTQINEFLTPDYMPVRNLDVSDLGQPIDDGSSQYYVQQESIDGSIDFIQVTNSGTNYDNANAIVVTVTGDGYNCNAFALTNTSTNTISGFVVTRPGYSFHYANVQISTINNANGSGATANAIISPFGGHGHDPTTELGATCLIFSVQLDEDMGNTLITTNSYRQSGILLNPLVNGTYIPQETGDPNTGILFSNTNFSQTYGITLNSGAGDYNNNEFVFQGGNINVSTFAAQVAAWDSPNNILYLVSPSGNCNTGLLIGQTSGTSRFVINTKLQSPALQPYSGYVLYFENFIPITRANNQSENHMIVIEF